MTTRPLLTLLAATCVCAAAIAQERIAPETSATSSVRTAPSEVTRANSATATTPADSGTRGFTHTIPMGSSSSFGGVSSTMSPTLEGAVGSGARTPGMKNARKVCPPGMENRDGNCVPPIDGIMRP